MENRSTAKMTKAILEKHGFRLKKSLGQNFLLDDHILKKIVALADITPDDGVIEIGPGAGALTQYLAEAAGKVVGLEIDRRLDPVLKEVLADCNNVEILFQDVLETDITELIAHHFHDALRVMVVANLPYYATTPILMKLLSANAPIDRIVVMIQKEVAERLEAEPGNKSYGSLSVAVQYTADVRLLTTVPASVFIPKPNVDSAVVRLDLLKEKRVSVRDEAFFFKVVRAAFAQRRKTLLNNLLHNLVGRDRKEETIRCLERLGIDPGRRGETLSIEEFARLSDGLLELL
ncbi:16S rRNA (adenine(1518)-N(6)/adenine(1519)-N(6))-dimethyltransferase RsmA [Caenibacillus caldisaponilyticus]|jgi:16S rRNA (adenine1518-N6/adenine1519-N6)-dimethyltransferase|uniref:16S rRNA (adenine(1518)-N(6)/adenine(1519)-N(6))- dimethyltransferase RsmA n=1 Tax=Caenibacillus caldisaponilyticus TaxID=1674942 RepID=UPI0009884A90|nr:16S rRNA (adenine(1518)-N(6)/adenine(1519)-N(6))-dimethyltransferase RsmA [Caenibacillus caldisaponilyticus]